MSVPTEPTRTNTSVTPPGGCASVMARVGPDSAVNLEPRRVAADRRIVLIETYVAEQLGTWRRLKVCRNETMMRQIVGRFLA